MPTQDEGPSWVEYCSGLHDKLVADASELGCEYYHELKGKNGGPDGGYTLRDALGDRSSGEIRRMAELVQGYSHVLEEMISLNLACQSRIKDMEAEHMNENDYRVLDLTGSLDWEIPELIRSNAKRATEVYMLEEQERTSEGASEYFGMALQVLQSGHPPSEGILHPGKTYDFFLKRNQRDI